MASEEQPPRVQALSELHRTLDAILRTDPARALEQARGLAANGILDSDDVASVRAAVCIDAGGDLSDVGAVEEGTTILRRLSAADPHQPAYRYNLANGLSTLASLKANGQLSGYLETAGLRREARKLFEEVALETQRTFAGGPELAARAKTNQANLLKDSFRWLEAYDSYTRAISLDPSNPVPSTGAAKLLKWLASIGLGPRAYLLGLASRLAELGRRAAEGSDQYSGAYGSELFSELHDIEAEPIDFDLTGADEYTRFVDAESLALSPTIEGVHPGGRRWDCLQVTSIREGVTENCSGQPPVIFAMFNTLKASFLTARWLAYQALHGSPPETSRYIDTLDYANYGIRSSLLTLAQRAAIDVLDSIAVAATEYLGLPAKKKQIYFWTRWHRDPNAERPIWQSEVETEIRAGNWGLLALSELAGDFNREYGFLWSKKDARNSSTHAFTILHEIGDETNRHCEHVLHRNAEDFAEEVLDSLRVARAAIFYLHGAIVAREDRLARGERHTLPMFVAWHDWVRGEDLDDVEVDESP